MPICTPNSQVTDGSEEVEMEKSEVVLSPGFMNGSESKETVPKVVLTEKTLCTLNPRVHDDGCNFVLEYSSIGPRPAEDQRNKNNAGSVVSGPVLTREENISQEVWDGFERLMNAGVSSTCSETDSECESEKG